MLMFMLIKIIIKFIVNDIHSFYNDVIMMVDDCMEAQK